MEGYRDRPGPIRPYAAEVFIQAPPEAAWRVLTDLGTYAEWNPLTPVVRSTLKPGALVWMFVWLRWLPVIQVERIRGVRPPTTLTWGVTFGWSRLLWAERVQSIVPHGDGCTYTTVDTIGGLLLPLVHRLFGGALKDGFQGMATALKAHTEAQAQAAQDKG